MTAAPSLFLVLILAVTAGADSCTFSNGSRVYDLGRIGYVFVILRASVQVGFTPCRTFSFVNKDYGNISFNLCNTLECGSAEAAAVCQSLGKHDYSCGVESTRQITELSMPGCCYFPPTPTHIHTSHTHTLVRSLCPSHTVMYSYARLYNYNPFVPTQTPRQNPRFIVSMVCHW